MAERIGYADAWVPKSSSKSEVGGEEVEASSKVVEPEVDLDFRKRCLQ